MSFYSQDIPTDMPEQEDVFVFPTSFAQHRVWFIDQVAAGAPIYNLPFAARLSGSIDLRILEQSLNEVAQRHEILRTSFAAVDGQPVQVIAPAIRLALQHVSLEAVPAAEREPAFTRHAQELLRQSFDLGKLPLLRATLFRFDQKTHVLLIVMHHILTDTWSIGVLIREMAAIYTSLLAGQPASLPELEIQYADFAEWQRNWLQGEALETQLAYWKQQLGGDLPVLNLPTDRPRPAFQSYNGARHLIIVPRAIVEQLKAFSQRQEATLYMTLLAAFKLLLHRYTGQHDLVVGAPIANRNQVEIEALIGFFVNTLVLRTNLSGNPTFRELLQRVKATAVDAYAHQDLPFELLVEALQPERSLSHNPLFQVMFEMGNAPLPPLQLPDVMLTPLQLDNGTSEFDLSLTLLEADQGMQATLEYNLDLFDLETIKRMGEQFTLLLKAIAEDADRPIASYSLLTEAECQLLARWNDTAVEYDRNVCIHQLFEAQAEANPAAIAVRFNGHSLTYGELNLRANQLANYLRRRGVGPETLVGLCVERSFEMAVAILGILKAGGAFVPLDPDYPQERLAFILENARIALMLTQTSMAKRVPSSSAEHLCLDRDWEQIAQESAATPPASVAPDHLAYVMYTSGSTGRPKGVPITHHALVYYTLGAIATFGLRSDDRILQFASISFDVAAEELFPTWACGATVVLRPDGVLPYHELLRLADTECLTGIELPTAYWHDWVQDLIASNAQLPASLRFMIIGGERILPDRLLAWKRFKIPLIHVYGLTEVTITSSTYRWDETERYLDNLPIGRPIANNQLYVLDAQMQYVPIGVPGELYIGGENLARGYFNHPALTAERFVPHPFSTLRGERLYRTGDLVRFLPDGNVRFLSRADQQVKIRGYRVELGEIEAVLAEHPSVHEAIVVAREVEQGDKRLVAYVVEQRSHGATKQPTAGAQNQISSAAPFSELDAAEKLRSYLKERLPDYMVPSQLVFLDALPLSPNGKVDLQALMKLDVGHAAAQSYEPPRDEMERMITAIWQETLQRETIGRNDNFFDLGGHSLLMAQVHSKLRKTLGRDIPIIELFKHPSIAALAGALGNDHQESAEPIQESTDRAAARRDARSNQSNRRQIHRATQEGQGETRG